MVAKFGDCVLLGGFAGFGWYGQGLNFWGLGCVWCCRGFGLVVL